MSCQQGTSAMNVITYIGVPLAVLGVFPMLWNTARSFWIRHYLASLIPARACKHVSLTIDPASGVVIVILDKPESRWQDAPARGFQPESPAAGIVREIDPRLVGCSWIGLYEAGVPVVRMGERSQRVVVDVSLRFESLSLRCDRKALLFLALGLGVDPYRNRLQGIPKGTMTDTTGKPVLSITAATRSSVVQLIPGLSFSERRALAWFCVMVVPNNRGVSYIPLSKVPGNPDFTRPPGFPSIEIEIERPDKRGISLDLALRGTCYAESVFYDKGNEELLPVPQMLLQAREDTLAQLQSLSARDLEAHLQAIFKSDINMINKVLTMLKKTWLDIVPDIKDNKGKAKASEVLGAVRHV